MEETVRLRIGGMHCADCAPPIALALKIKTGVIEASIDYRSASGSVMHDSSKVQVSDLIALIEHMGYTAKVEH